MFNFRDPPPSPFSSASLVRLYTIQSKNSTRTSRTAFGLNTCCASLFIPLCALNTTNKSFSTCVFRPNQKFNIKSNIKFSKLSDQHNLIQHQISKLSNISRGPASAASPLPGSACRVAPWRLPETPGLGLGLLRVAENGAKTCTCTW